MRYENPSKPGCYIYRQHPSVTAHHDKDTSETASLSKSNMSIKEMLQLYLQDPKVNKKLDKGMYKILCRQFEKRFQKQCDYTDPGVCEEIDRAYEELCFPGRISGFYFKEKTLHELQQKKAEIQEILTTLTVQGETFLSYDDFLEKLPTLTILKLLSTSAFQEIFSALGLESAIASEQGFTLQAKINSGAHTRELEYALEIMTLVFTTEEFLHECPKLTREVCEAFLMQLVNKHSLVYLDNTFLKKEDIDAKTRQQLRDLIDSRLQESDLQLIKLSEIIDDVARILNIDASSMDKTFLKTVIKDFFPDRYTILYDQIKSKQTLSTCEQIEQLLAKNTVLDCSRCLELGFSMQNLCKVGFFLNKDQIIAPKNISPLSLVNFIQEFSSLFYKGEQVLGLEEVKQKFFKLSKVKLSRDPSFNIDWNEWLLKSVIDHFFAKQFKFVLTTALITKSATRGYVINTPKQTLAHIQGDENLYCFALALLAANKEQELYLTPETVTSLTTDVEKQQKIRSVLEEKGYISSRYKSLDFEELVTRLRDLLNTEYDVSVKQ